MPTLRLLAVLLGLAGAAVGAAGAAAGSDTTMEVGRLLVLFRGWPSTTGLWREAERDGERKVERGREREREGDR